MPDELAEAAAAEPLDPILDLRDGVHRLEVRMARVEVKMNVALALTAANLLLVLCQSFAS